MPFWRRAEPVHKKLGRALANAEAGGGFLAHPPALDGSVGLGEPGIHGVPRPRRWDAVVSAEADDLPGDAVHFTALPDGTLVVEEDVPDGALVPLADAVEEVVAPPYRAEATRHGRSVWAVAAQTVEVVEIGEEIPGDEIELAVTGEGRSVRVDGAAASLRLRELETLAAEYAHYVARAQRLDGDLWEVQISPL